MTGWDATAEPRLYQPVEKWREPVECPDCGAAVLDREKHDGFHAKIAGRMGTS